MHYWRRWFNPWQHMAERYEAALKEIASGKPGYSECGEIARKALGRDD